MHSGGKPEFGAMFVREVAGVASGVGLGLGYLWVVFDRNRQAWRERFAGTVVVRTR